MTYRPGDKGQAAWERIVQLNPQREGEAPSAWMARLLAAVDEVREPEGPARLPYRDDA